MLDSEVAARFGVETRAVNQAVARNPRKFRAKHCFRLSEEEALHLRSQSVMASGGHGGRRNPPMVFTMFGIARLATVLTTDEALYATDLILDTFLEVRAQLAAGQPSVTLGRPARLLGGPGEAQESVRFRQRLRDALSALLDTVIDMRSQASIGDVAGAMTSDALSHLRERLRTRGLENEKLAAETELVLQQAELMAAQVRKTDAETDGIALKNLETRIGLVKQIADMHGRLEAPALIAMLDDLSTSSPSAALPYRGVRQEEEKD